MFTFAVVKKIGEGKYLFDDFFILERIRRERALQAHSAKPQKKHKNRFLAKDGKEGAS